MGENYTEYEITEQDSSRRKESSRRRFVWSVHGTADTEWFWSEKSSG